MQSVCVHFGEKSSTKSEAVNSCGWLWQHQRIFTSQFNQLNWKSTVHSCTTSCSQLPRLPACLGCLLLNIDRHLECHSSTIKLQRASEAVPALFTVCHTHTHTHTADRHTCTQRHLGRGVWHHCESEALATISSPFREIGCFLKGTVFWRKTVSCWDKYAFSWYL